MRGSDLLCVPRIFFAATSVTMFNLGYCLFEATVLLRLEDYDVLKTYQGIIFPILSFSYMVGSQCVSYLVPKWVEKRVTIIFGTFLFGVSNLLVGPAIGEKNLVSMIGGLILSGFFMGPMFTPNMGEMMFVAKKQFSDESIKHTNNKLSGIIQCLGAIGMAVGPLMGSYLYEVFGFRYMCNTMAGVAILFAACYFLFCDGYEAITSTCKNYNRVQWQKQADRETAAL